MERSLKEFFLKRKSWGIDSLTLFHPLWDQLWDQVCLALGRFGVGYRSGDVVGLIEQKRSQRERKCCWAEVLEQQRWRHGAPSALWFQQKLHGDKALSWDRTVRETWIILMALKSPWRMKTQLHLFIFLYISMFPTNFPSNLCSLSLFPHLLWAWPSCSFWFH